MKTRSILSGLVFATVILFSGMQTTQAQECCEKQCEFKNALQFQIGSNFSLNNFKGYTISYRYRLNNTAGLRFGVSLSGDIGDDDSKTFSDTLMYNLENDHNVYSIIISTEYLKKITSAKNIDFYIGAGPRVGYTYSKLKADNLYPSQPRSVEEKRKTFSAGVTMLAGVEWFVTDNISFSGEYGMIFAYEWYKNTMSETTKTASSLMERKSSNFELTGENARLGVSVYF